MARPMPLVEPVTITTLPVRSNSSAVSRMQRPLLVCLGWLLGLARVARLVRQNITSLFDTHEKSQPEVARCP